MAQFLVRAEFAMAALATDTRKILELAGTLVAALALMAALKAPAQALTTQQSNHMLIIPASDGYGYDDCLAAGNKACGQVIADAWCEAHGMSTSTSFGRADDITATTPVAAGAKPVARIDPGAFIVNCKD